MSPNDLSLTEAFLAALKPRPPASAPGDLEPALRNALQTARDAWPSLDVPPAAFAAYLAMRVEPPPGAASIGALRAPDLYLACGCVRRDARAIAAFEACHFAEVTRTLARMGVAAHVADDVKGALRERLFFSPTGEPALAGYSGRGELGRWVRSVAVREALKGLRAALDVPSDGAALDLALSTTNPELDYIKTSFAAEFRAALETAFGALSTRERNLLRQYLIDGLNVDQLGKIYHLHRATVARQIAAVRERLLGEVRRTLGERLRLNDAELQSALRLARSRLDVSVRRLLLTRAGEGPKR
jgi:RNA polymerase sigma-70 factor, ECF subfamily